MAAQLIAGVQIVDDNVEVDVVVDDLHRFRLRLRHGYNSQTRV